MFVCRTRAFWKVSRAVSTTYIYIYIYIFMLLISFLVAEGGAQCHIVTLFPQMDGASRSGVGFTPPAIVGALLVKSVQMLIMRWTGGMKAVCT